MLVMMQRNWIVYTLLVGILNGTASLEKNMAVSYKTKHELAVYQLHFWTFVPGKLKHRNLY